MPAGHSPGSVWKEVLSPPGRVPGAGCAGPPVLGLGTWGGGARPTEIQKPFTLLEAWSRHGVHAYLAKEPLAVRSSSCFSGD